MFINDKGGHTLSLSAHFSSIQLGSVQLSLGDCALLQAHSDCQLAEKVAAAIASACCELGVAWLQFGVHKLCTKQNIKNVIIF
jgi:hypothetical protein